MAWLRGDDYRKALAKAGQESYALLACNIAGDSQIKAFVQAASAKGSDIILQISASAARFASGEKNDPSAGLKILSDMVRDISDQYTVGTAIHIDHAKPEHLDMVRFAIEKELVSSVMIDFSAEPYEKNLEVSKEITDLAHEKGILVEAELGKIGGVEDDVSAEGSLYTSPEEAADFLKKTGVDLFACSIGTKHGVTKAGNIKLRVDILQDIHNALLTNNFHTGLVLHGASGVTAEQLKECINKGIVKVNKDTVFQMSFARAVNSYWQDNEEAITTHPEKKRFDPRVWLRLAEKGIQKDCEELIDIAGSSGKSVF